MCAKDHKTLMKLKTQLNGKILSVPWTEEWTLFEYIYYPKHSTH